MTMMCYVGRAKDYRNQMAGSPEATHLKKPTDTGVDKWNGVSNSFSRMVDDIKDAINAAEGAHSGRAAEAARASIDEITPHARAASETAKGVGKALTDQINNQNQAFEALPRQGEKLPDGKDVQLDPPQKGWVEDWGLDKFGPTSWMSDYEDKQQAFQATNDHAEAVMQRYQAQTNSVIGQVPEFKPVDQPAPPQQPPPGSGMPDASSHMAGSHMSTPSVSGSPAGTSSAWASGAGGGGGAGAVHLPSGGSSGVPAGTQSAWASTPSAPPGVVQGPDGTMYRQNPQTGEWERQNPYNGRWAPSPNGGPGGSGRAGGAGGAGGARGAGGFGRGGAGARGGGQIGAGGRAGAGGVGQGSAGSGSGSSASGGRGSGPMGGAGAGRGGQKGEDDQEHSRPSWLTEEEDVFTNDMQRVAPPVFGDWSNGGR